MEFSFVCISVVLSNFSFAVTIRRVRTYCTYEKPTTDIYTLNSRAVWLNIPLLVVVGLLCCLNGLVVYAAYADCDLATDGKITSNDQVSRKSTVHVV